MQIRGSIRGGTIGILMLLMAGGTPSVAQPDASAPGSEMPSDTLEQVDGSTIQLREAAGEAGTVLIFWSNQCPWIDRYEGRVQALVDRFQGEGIQFVLVNANDASAFPQESLEVSRERAGNYEALYVRDQDASLARALGASRTPHVFVFDANRTLVYTGTIDDSPSDAGNATKTYLADTLAALTGGGDVPVAETKAFGCTIKFPSP